jgi:hypothetical protein
MRKSDMPPTEEYISPEVLSLIVNLEKRVAEQGDLIQKMERKTTQLEKNVRILISELIQSGYINVPERRKMLKRSLLDHQALMNLLKKKGVINTREFRREIKQLLLREKAIKSG